MWTLVLALMLSSQVNTMPYHPTSVTTISTIYPSLVYTYHASISISASISTRVLTCDKHTHKHNVTYIHRRSALKFWPTLYHPIWRIARALSCACTCVIPVYTSDASISASTRKKKNYFLFLYLRLCLRLCLSLPGLHLRFLRLCLRCTCKPGFIV